ncbi:membrane-bound lytic murein transglycosylase B [Pseudomonas duriflava]|uniref:Membrane-bound lytic murein transglycosylase B n=1 Tax=Pseudomonas duriflava TaxID=459528 RepID=A0A562QBX1_9PSED|nr:lytic murein transglycosylase B [Pseudomonas duriflava]TWI54238.1 membrane-bound lytic murein transglycosylase B [Pseudomonas duriflava]
MLTPFGWIGRCLQCVGLIGTLVITSAASAGDYDNSPQAADFIKEMTQNYGFAHEQLTDLFREVSRKQSILQAISRPAERVKSWSEYRPIFVTDRRIAQGVAFWNENASALARAEREYGVPAQFIVAIIGVETFYGRNKGNYRVLDALSTLTFDYPQRAPFFRSQLREFLLLSREQQLDPLSLNGSYAGAMGLPQFMPGSFRAYAVDFDGDGHIDIWSNPADAIGSVANYFKRHGWTAGDTVVARAQVKGSRIEEGVVQSIEPTKSVAELRDLGWTSQAELRDDLKVTSFRLDGEAGPEYWMGLPNFYAITRYNRSVMYAMAVNQLAEAIAVRHSREVVQ